MKASEIRPSRLFLGNVPALKERARDFSEVETTPGVANIYDPLTTKPNPVNAGTKQLGGGVAKALQPPTESIEP